MAPPKIQIKRSTTSSTPTLSFGELGLSSSSTGNILSIGDNTGTTVPVNALKVFSTTLTSYTVPQWNSFLVCNAGLLGANITLPSSTNFNIGQVIYIKNIGSLSITLLPNTGNTINGTINLSVPTASSIRIISMGNNNVYSF